jgi:hypothetical protein
MASGERMYEMIKVVQFIFLEKKLHLFFLFLIFHEMQVFVLQRQLIIFTLGENKSNQSPLSSPMHTEGNTNPFSDTNFPKPGTEMDIGALHSSINLFLLRKPVYSMIICSVALLSLVLQPGY